ncbi:MAG: S8 family serine peptidase [Elusimicrobia bacterium]|nr:S8 family serine peptidase [Elusimicrobiota bacterium]
MKPLPLLAALLAALHASPALASGPVRKIIACRPEVSARDCSELARRAGGAIVRELPSINAVVVEVPAFRAAHAHDALKASFRVDLIETDRTINWLKAASAAPPAAARFEAGAAVRELLARVDALKPAAPADPEQPWGIRRVNAAASWTTPRGQGAGVSVAVIDTGISRTHPDLAGLVLGGFNALDPKKPDAWDDDQGHGSHVAGTISARRDGRGVVGAAPMARLYAVKVLDAEGNGSFSSVIAGIEWAASRGLKIANMSLGADEGSEALGRAVAAAAKAGLTIVAAAGNTGGAVSFPAAYPETIAVAASDAGDGAADFSSRGPEVDFIAPGVNVRSVDKDGGWVEHSGTSMAAPHVAGLAALALARGAATPAAIRAALAKAAAPLPGLAPAVQGLGMIDAGKLP